MINLHLGLTNDEVQFISEELAEDGKYVWFFFFFVFRPVNHVD